MRELHLGRLFYHADGWRGLALPRIHFYAEGDDFVGLGFGIEHDGSDPAWAIDIDLSGTQLGKVVDRLAEQWEKFRNACGQ